MIAEKRKCFSLLHLAWQLTVYCLVVCRSGANAVKAEIKAEELKTEGGQTEVCTCGHCITIAI